MRSFSSINKGAMASTCSPPVLQVLSVHYQCNAQPCSLKPKSTKPSLAIGTNRWQLLFLVTATTLLTVKELGSNAEDIPLFGLRKKLRSAEEEPMEIVKEGFEAMEKGLVTVERGIEIVERGIETTEKGLESVEKGVEAAVSFGGLAQVLGVVVATSVMNRILGPES